ncbi:MAG: winged helix-turn-helix domain-containing protein [Kibdelosporangium sp.]
MPTAQLTVTLQLTIEAEYAPALAAQLVSTLRTLPVEHVIVDDPIDRIAAALRIHTDSRRVVVRDSPVELTRLEFDLLLYLCRHHGRVHRREALLAEVWGIPEHLGTRTVDVHIRRLRHKLGYDVITTVRGVGYLVDREAGFAIESS